MSRVGFDRTAVAAAARQAFAWFDPLSTAHSPLARSQRVTVLLIGTTIMCLADLYMTLLFVRNVGMIESNPLARLVMSHNSPALVVLWKLALTVFGIGVLFFFRRGRNAEIATWVVFIAMTGLMIHWIGFAQGAAAAAEEYHILALTNDPRWVVMPGE
ncbi:hypothetical protein PHYC_00809 [Phycisphaerales bacterium]|nr:hypothetical protein PHYC_00809 [Phycisphaerales bacterium]